MKVHHNRLNREPGKHLGTYRLFSLRPIRDELSGNRRAYSLIEVAIALAVFGLLAGLVTVAIARAQLGAVGARFEREARGIMTSMVDQVSTGDTQGLIDGSFIRPNTCSDRSCSLDKNQTNIIFIF
jgi:prepilin-type N-terminal cleavage/methylation domain-containing protein